MTTNSIVEGSGLYLLDWPSSGAIPTSYSAGGWTYGNEGLAQQTFLGASIKSFSMKGGFGGSSSTVSLNLVEDKYNQSDGKSYGLGDDVYHNGARDSFAPPVVGSPVFFKFGKYMATVAEAFTPTLDILYGQSLFLKSRDPKDLLYSSYLAPEAFGQFDEFISGTGGKIHARPEAGDVAPYDTAYFSGVKNGNNIWINEYRKIYGADRGRDHLAFGGILQNTNENKSATGGPAYSVNIVDPREILSNVSLILKDYAGSNYGQQNMLNVFGFLEYDPSDDLKTKLEAKYDKSLLTKKVLQDGTLFFTDTAGLGTPDLYTSKNQTSKLPGRDPLVFPVTGEGMSRRSDKGMPFYRITQAIDALLSYNGKLFDEYAQAFGTQINFRGFKYVVDFSGLPLDMIPKMYNIDFAQTDLLSLCQEICDVVNRDLFVSLMPVISHPYCSWLYEYNQDRIYNDDAHNVVAGIIRIDSIDRSAEPEYGIVKLYLDQLERESGVDVTNRDLGYELTNNPVDKFVVGAQETKLHYFNTENDRDHNEIRKMKFGLENKVAERVAGQWDLKASLDQQILPFYGFLGKDVVTIPRGWGSYQQILLDARSLRAHGVDNYYVATELELRAALVSYERWKEFLLLYSEVYMESLEEDDFIEAALIGTVTIDTSDQAVVDMANKIGATTREGVSNNYSVTVPRCVWRSDKDYVNDEGLPASACSPPFGYPLYYKRAQRIGIPEAGVAKIASQIKQVFTDYATLVERLGEAEEIEELAMSSWSDFMNEIAENVGAPTKTRQENEKSARDIIEWYNKIRGFFDTIKDKVNKPYDIVDQVGEGNGGIDDPAAMETNTLANAVNTVKRINTQIATIENLIKRNCAAIKSVSRLGKKTIENSMKVYDFVKKVAEKHLGKTYLVKIPRTTNLNYSTEIRVAPWGEVLSGPFGFRPEPVNKDPNYYYTAKFQAFLQNLEDKEKDYTYGALKSNFDPISDQWKHNYKPSKAGGYFDYHINPQTVMPHLLFGDLGDASAASQEATNIAGGAKRGNLADIEKNRQAGAAAINGQLFLPPVVKSYLYPVNGTNFVEDNGRVPAYVRFDNSQFLNFKGVPAEKVFQQTVTDNPEIIPEIVPELDNMDDDQFHSFDTAKILSELPKAIAFVQVDVDEKLYMPPKLEEKDTVIFGRYVQDIGAMSTPRKIWNKDSCKFEYTMDYYRPHWVPHITTGGAGPTEGDVEIGILPEGMKNKKQVAVNWYDFQRFPEYSSLRAGAQDKKFIGNIVETNLKDVNSDHVYAIITLPGRISPTIDSRMQDGPYQAFQAPTTKHYLTMDTVKIPGIFDEPAWKKDPTARIANLCSIAGIGTLQNAFKAYKVAMEKLSIASPEARIHFTAPSPVYPNMVAIPMQSTERCYGPWVSSFIDDASYSYLDSNPRVARYANLGGKVEFEKDESLAPWNFGGYYLLDEAGSLKAAFSNSLQLFAERGSFTYVGIPRGNSLGKALTNGGPLVTDINVDVGTNGIKTSVKMDLFTPKFGKLKKQHENIIGQVTREKQRIRDQRNLLIRNHLIQETTETEYTKEFKKYSEFTSAIESNYESFSPLQKNSTVNDMAVAQLQYEDVVEVTIDGSERRYRKTNYDLSSMPNRMINEGLQMFPDRGARDKAVADAVIQPWSEFFSPASESDHPNMTHKKETFREQKKNELYKQQNTGFE
jgi:hypothetical protein